MNIFKTIVQPSFQTRLSREGHTAVMPLLESVPEHNFWTVQYVFGHMRRVPTVYLTRAGRVLAVCWPRAAWDGNADRVPTVC